MPRYDVLEGEQARPHVVMETCDPDAALGFLRVVTRFELCARYPRALAAWESKDDDLFERYMATLAAEDD